DLVVELPF
ncbi:hypothetical protein MK382_10105, partial [Streptococcus pneumoniae]|nr:hypothetical protein [Streptococcus pneumoniae]